MRTLSFEGYNIPPHTQETIRRYLEYGYMPGSFLTAVIGNDLVRAVCKADHMNQACLVDIVKWVYNNMPTAARGNESEMMYWCLKIRKELDAQEQE